MGPPHPTHNEPTGAPVRATAAARRAFIGVVLLVVLSWVGAAIVPAGGRTMGAWALVFGGAAATAVFVATWGTAWATVGAWSALYCVGQGAALSWVDAGPGVRYQHLLLFREGWHWVGWVAAAVVTVQVFFLFARAREACLRACAWLWTEAGTLRTAAVGLAFVLTAAALSRDPSYYVVELAASTTLQLLALGCVIAAATAVSEDQSRALWEGVRAGLASPRLPWLVAAWVFAVSVVLIWWVYEFHPHVPDEVVYLVHARYFAAGFLELSLPPVPAAFELDLVSYQVDRLYVPVPPGWPAALAVGVALGAPWLVNPFLGAASVPLVYRFVRGLYGARTAGAVCVLLALSPWFVFLNMSLMTHSFTLFAGAIAAAYTGRRIRGGAWGWIAVAGVGLGLVALNRPLEGLVAAAGLGVWGLLASGSQPEDAPGTARRPGLRRVSDVGTLAVVSAAVVGTTLPYNAHFTGDPLTFPIMQYADEIYGEGSNALGFGPDKGLGFGGLDPFPGHGLADVLVNSALNFFQINIELAGWGVGSVLILVLFVFALSRWRRPDAAMLGVVALVAGSHAFYWFSGGPDFGARYWYLALVPLIVLSTRGLQALAERVNPGRVALAALVVCVSATTVFGPWRASDKYREYRGMEPGIRELARTEAWGPDDVILVRGDRHPDYASAAVYNPVDLRGEGPLYVWDRGEDVREALRLAYPNRRFWRVDGPSITGGGFSLVDPESAGRAVP